MYTISAHSLSC